MSALPIEIWNYIFDIKRRNFKLLLLKFQNKLEYRIAWKNFYEGCYYNSIDGTMPPSGIFHLEFYHYNLNAIAFKLERSLGSIFYCGGIKEYILTFRLVIPISGVQEVYPNYNFKLKSSTTFTTYDLGFYVSRDDYLRFGSGPGRVT